jgi:hypothetical protein
MEHRTYLRSEDLPLQLEVSGKLLHLMASVTEGTIHPPGGRCPRNTVFLLLISKAINTVRGIQSLVERELSDEAIALLRTMIEITVNATYILHVGGDAQAQRYVDFPMYKRYLSAKRLREVSPALVSYSSDQWDDMKHDYERFKPVYGKDARDWTSVSLYKRAESFDNVKAGNKLRVYVRTLYSAACSDVHGDALSVQAHLQIESGNNFVVQRRPTPGELSRALFFANDVAFFVTWQLGEFSGQQKEADAIGLYRMWAGQ